MQPRTVPTRTTTRARTPEQWYAFDAKTHKRLLNAIGQPFPPGASKKQLLSDLRGQAKDAVLLRSPAGTVWANDPVAASERNRGAGPLRDVPPAE